MDHNRIYLMVGAGVGVCVGLFLKTNFLSAKFWSSTSKTRSDRQAAASVQKPGRETSSAVRDDTDDEEEDLEDELDDATVDEPRKAGDVVAAAAAAGPVVPVAGASDATTAAAVAALNEAQSTALRRETEPSFATVAVVQRRKHMDTARWRCIARPQYVVTSQRVSVTSD